MRIVASTAILCRVNGVHDIVIAVVVVATSASGGLAPDKSQSHCLAEHESGEDEGDGGEFHVGI